MMMCLATWAQNDEITRAQADKLDSITVKLMNQERYEDAIKAKERELTILKSLYGENDSTYIRQLAFSAKLYYRNKQVKEAATIVEKAAQLYAENISNNDDLYAFYLDNLSLYQLSIEEYAKAKENCRKALTIYEQLGKKDYDLAIILMHMAEACHYNGETQDALKFELRALNTIKNVYGRHSDEYIGELSFLQKYYQALGDEKNAKEIEETISKLQKEKEDGIVDLPEPTKFKSEEICREHNADAFKCIKYYLTHKLSASQINQAAQYIINWTDASGDVNIPVGEEMASLVTSEKTLPYFVAYLAAYSYYCLTENTKQLDEKFFAYAINILLQFYEPNSELTGKVELLENYLELQKKGKLEKELSKVFAKAKK
jgi:tetratricopeptide (TPR) repeat protein